MIQPERLRVLNRKDVARGEYVLYWMQASPRAHYNHALEYAVLRANELDQPLVVCFGITPGFPDANLRHYCFMLEGLREVRRELRRRGVLMVIRRREPDRLAVTLGRRASLVVVDGGYLNIQRRWRRDAAAALKCPLVQVESDVVVPVETASPKEEYAAATIRPKIRSHLDAFLVPLKPAPLRRKSLRLRLETLDLESIDAVLKPLKIDRRVPAVDTYTGGTSEARKRLKYFISRRLRYFGDRRNDPSFEGLSNLSPYLHFGQISPLYVALEVGKSRAGAKDSFLEELVVRRELSMNFCHYNHGYDSYGRAVPEWARKTLAAHRGDEREYVYPASRLEAAETHDPYWNAAQKQMLLTGKMHGYMRMYWGKKILEWGGEPERAFEIALHLNNKYELDGRDPNGFTGVAWCFGKHDRAWAERPVFGKVRYMNARGLRRKFDIDSYVKQVEELEKGSK
jgi:deoxyribodipyrimidine photo-lyase